MHDDCESAVVGSSLLDYVYIALASWHAKAYIIALHTPMRQTIRHYCYAILPYILRVGLLFLPVVITYVNPSIRFAHACEISILILIVIFRNGIP
ncbi:MAG TPA: hypothetical protein VMH89_14280, partial [Candidatus Acidoferrum sp.]|nr:hypothetical protein [Candidatus Acidoferrum sp.]